MLLVLFISLPLSILNTHGNTFSTLLGKVMQQLRKVQQHQSQLHQAQLQQPQLQQAQPQQAQLHQAQLHQSQLLQSQLQPQLIQLHLEIILLLTIAQLLPL